MAVAVAFLARVVPTAAQTVAVDRTTFRAMLSELAIKRDFCPRRALPGDMVQINTCVFRQQRPIWMRYLPQTIDVVDRYIKSMMEISRLYDQRTYDVPAYEAAKQAIAVSFRTGLRERLIVQGAPNDVQAVASSTQANRADVCNFLAALTGVVAGVASRRAETGVNAGNSFLQGCMR
jgi:hypothetical protein